ncbi:MAG TPA: sulfate permease [Geobacteraceae bacterium]|nr:sulfate permease [Geobacteraceae bacterium]
MKASSKWKLGRFAPGLAALMNYEKSNFRFDIVAGLSVAAVALPVGIAYAEIARVPAVVGIYSAIFPLFAYALFGSSRQLMTGPDAATCIMAASSIGAITGGDPSRYSLLMVALTLMTGLFYIAAGIARLGFIANFLSQPILVGYLHGIALIILGGQIPKLFGFSAQGDGFFPQVAAFVEHLGSTQPATLALGGSLLLLLIAMKLFLPRLPGPLIVAAIGIIAVIALRLTDRGVAVLGPVAAGLPPFQLSIPGLSELRRLVLDAAGLMLISFTSGVLTSKSFARRSGYDIDANQELIGFGAANLASAFVQGFPVTGADSRTAVNSATGGRTQLVGIVAGVAMLSFLLFFTPALALLPKTALAAIIIVSAFGFFDITALRTLWRASGRELLFSLATTGGVLFCGAFPGVFIAVILSLLWLLSAVSRPNDAILGRVSGIDGFHDIKDYPEATTIPGLLIYRFEADLVFFNCDLFKERVQQEIRRAATPVEWVLVDASPITVIDYTAMQMIQEFREELAAQGIELAFAKARHHLAHFFRPAWVEEIKSVGSLQLFPGIKSGIQAFEQRVRRENEKGHSL